MYQNGQEFVFDLNVRNVPHYQQFSYFADVTEGADLQPGGNSSVLLSCFSSLPAKVKAKHRLSGKEAKSFRTRLLKQRAEYKFFYRSIYVLSVFICVMLLLWCLGQKIK